MVEKSNVLMLLHNTTEARFYSR